MEIVFLSKPIMHGKAEQAKAIGGGRCISIGHVSLVLSYKWPVIMGSSCAMVCGSTPGARVWMEEFGMIWCKCMGSGERFVCIGSRKHGRFGICGSKSRPRTNPQRTS